MTTIGILCAMDSEFAQIQKSMTHGITESIGRQTFYVGEKGTKRIVSAMCGVGKVNAAACAQMMISNFKADYVINSGVSGALSPKLHILDIVIANEVVYHDMSGETLEKYFPHCSRYIPDTRISDIVEELCKNEKFPCLRGKIVTGDQFVVDSLLKNEIYTRTNGDTIEMEGAAVGHVCYINNIPFSIVRCVSDGADDDAQMNYETFLHHAAARCAKITLALIDRI